jgi:signal transduction histidine kinase
VDDFLDLRALKDGKMSLIVEPVDLGSLVGEAAEQFQTYTHEKNVTLQTDIQPLPVVQADPNRLAQVLNNLIGNAVKFSPAGTSVTIRTSQREDRVRVEVEDNGPGIPAQEVPLLFQEFARLTNRPTGTERSSGIGLAITRYLVELHGGTIGAESEAGRGSLFWFELPIT